MKKIAYPVFGLMFGLMLSVPAANSADLKLGYVNSAELMEKAPQADAARSRFEQEFAPRRNKLQAEVKELKQLEEKLVKDGVTMSESERAKMERDVLARKRDLGRIQEELRDDVNIRNNEELGKLQQIVKETIDTLGKDEGYDMIFFDVAAFVNPKLDITAKVLQRLRDRPKDAPVAAKPKK